MESDRYGHRLFTLIIFFFSVKTAFEPHELSVITCTHLQRINVCYKTCRSFHKSRTKAIFYNIMINRKNYSNVLVFFLTLYYRTSARERRIKIGDSSKNNKIRVNRNFSKKITITHIKCIYNNL